MLARIRPSKGSHDRFSPYFPNLGQAGIRYFYHIFFNIFFQAPGDRVGGGVLALLVLTPVAGDSAVRRLRLHSAPIRAHQRRRHQAYSKPPRNQLMWHYLIGPPTAQGESNWRIVPTGVVPTGCYRGTVTTHESHKLLINCIPRKVLHSMPRLGVSV
eukprot:1196363-Prorocentrum_minimum.AAC.3